MVTWNEDEKEPVQRGPLRRVIIPCLVSYVGYGLLGAWCLIVELQHEAEYEERKAAAPDPTVYHENRSPVLQLRASYGLLPFSALRILTLFLFVNEKESSADRMSTIFLSISTLLMMVAYFTANLNLHVFLLIHPTFITIFFVLIAFDFVGNVSVLIRNSPLY